MCGVLKKQVGRFPAKVLGNVGDNHKAEGCTFFTRTPWRIFCPHMNEKARQKHEQDEFFENILLTFGKVLGSMCEPQFTIQSLHIQPSAPI